MGVPVPVGLYAYSFLLRLYHFSSVSPHVENCICPLSTAKRLPLQSLTLCNGCRPWHPLHMSLLIANSLLRGTTAFHGSSENVHPCALLNDKFLLSTATEGRRIEQKRCLPLQTRKSIYNMDVVNRCNLLLLNTTDILVRSEQSYFQ